MGQVSGIQRGSRSIRLTVGADVVLQDARIGDSIAVNGVCLTVTEFAGGCFVADVMPETMDKTSLANLKSGDRVNLERALRVGDRLGGHIVSGHVDGVGTIIEQNRQDIALVIRIAAPQKMLRYILPKGSVAIDGISLTVVEIRGDSFTVSLIPHTAKQTTLGWKSPGDPVNLETDIIGKYVERLLSGEGPPEKKGIDQSFLAEHGFI